MNPYLTQLQPYPFEKLVALKAEVRPPQTLEHIALSIGEPKHKPPAFVLETLKNNLQSLANYPVTKGLDELRLAIADWLNRRFSLSRTPIDSNTQVIPVAGTREALFSFAQAVIEPLPGAFILMPNPFYQIYEGATILAGAKPYFLNCTQQNGFVPDYKNVPEHVWQNCQMLYLCTPGNPTGALHSEETLKYVIQLSDEFDFVIASDECYSEIYQNEANPPLGLLEVCERMGRADFKNCVVFHSLSKRSNLPGLRSGFVAGDAEVLQKYLKYRTYHGCALPVPTQLASIAAWNDEQHVIENRNQYRQKFAAVSEVLKDILAFSTPEAGFYLWPQTPIDDTQFTQQLFAHSNVTVLPGQYLARPTAAGNPGKHHVRMALVATVDECTEAAQRIKQFVNTL